jgi:hypothetical protein
MSGAIDVFYGSGGSSGGGAVVASWANIYGHLTGNTGYSTVTGFSGTHVLAVSWTGSPYKVLAINGSSVTDITSSGTYPVTPGETVMFEIYSGASSTQSGTVTVKDSSAGSATVATFTYVVTAP